jgi:hypothetical protein
VSQTGGSRTERVLADGARVDDGVGGGNNARMGRPKLWGETLVVRLRQGTTQTIDSLKGKQDRSAFVREAIAKEIERRITRKQTKPKREKP